MEPLILLALLQIKHCYADFVLQTYIQTVKKGVWLDPIGVSHSLEHMISTLVVLFVASYFIELSPILVVIIAIIEMIVHYLIDYSKVKYGCKDQTNPIFWTQFGLDQLLHQLTYLVMVYILIWQKSAAIMTATKVVLALTDAQPTSLKCYSNTTLLFPVFRNYFW